MHGNKNAAETDLARDIKSPIAPCAACVVIGIIVGVSLTLAGLRYHQKTSNTMLLGWKIAEWDPGFSSCGGDTPAEFDFSENPNTVNITTLSGARFTSSYDLEPAEDSVSGYGKTITIHNYLGLTGCDVSLDFGPHQPLAHVDIEQVGGDVDLDLFGGEQAGEMSIGYLFCG
ncbi:MAG: hypothetical protein Q4A07_00465 [Coriobacteriales bacterium]|nr:hypothetical protein [Coriobacteriales bacterium]